MKSGDISGRYDLRNDIDIWWRAAQNILNPSRGTGKPRTAKSPWPKHSKAEVKKRLINFRSYHLCVLALTFYTSGCGLSTWNLHPNNYMTYKLACQDTHIQLIANSSFSLFVLFCFGKSSDPTMVMAYHPQPSEDATLSISLPIVLLNYIPWSLLCFTISTDSKSSETHWFLSF